MTGSQQGQLIGVVGASGAGKDSVIDALCAARSNLHRARRVITRAVDSGGEDHLGVSAAEFEALRQRGDFCLAWHAHGLGYGIPAGARDVLASGQDVIVNLSRRVLRQAQDRLGPCVFLNITAPPDVLSKRLRARGRESEPQIAARVARIAPMPKDLTIHDIDNGGTLDAAVAQALAVLDRADTPATIGTLQ